MTNWPITKLGSIAEFKNGLNYSQANWGVGLKIIGVSDFKNFLYPTYENLKQINPEGIVRNSDYLREEDILFVRSNGNRDLIGRCLFIKGLKEKISHSGFTIRLRFNRKKTYPPFYLYLFRTPLIRNVLSNFGGGTNINNLNQKTLSNLNVPVPTLKIQKKIAAILSAYDDLIENNQRRIALLEKMAEEIYREWFVRFRFPGHETAIFVKGIPEGWRTTDLGAIADLTMGQSPKSEFYNQEGNGLPFNQGVGTYGNRFPKRVTYCSTNGRKAKMGDILFSVRAPVGRLNIADCDMIIGRGLAAIRHKNNLNSYLYYLLKIAFSNEDIIGNGAIFNSVGKDELKKFNIFEPDKNLVIKFNETAKIIDQQIYLLTRSLENLTKTRNLLLPRLISGKLSVENLNIQFPPSMQAEEESDTRESAHA